MKIREDFVTNSSSSSFVINKDIAINIDGAYELIRTLYIDFYDKVYNAINLLKNMPNYPVYFDNEKKMFCRKKPIDKKNYTAITEDFERQFGFSIYDNISFEYYDWFKKCKTYEGYINYWISAIRENKEHYTHAPFIVVELNNDKTPLIDVKNGNDTANVNYKTTNENIYNEIINWYFDCGDNFFIDIDDPCISKCIQRKCFSCFEKNGIKVNLKEIDNSLPNLEMTSENCHFVDSEYIPSYIVDELNCSKTSVDIFSFTNFIGNVCIFSESGYIPDYIVKQLREFSTLSCNHMG